LTDFWVLTPIFSCLFISNAFTILPHRNRLQTVRKMGLNDLTLEKLIGEINGYKEKMRSIHEDYGRTSQELQDRINVLGYNLNEHLKETKDQISSTPQRLLTLETKYVSGEVGEPEYRSQREEFKHLLERNLHSIEEIRSMITVLSHIEARPLNATEFKPANQTPTPKAVSSEEWGRGVFSQDRPSPSLTQSVSAQSLVSSSIGPKFNPEPTAPTNTIENLVSTSSPSPPQPQPVRSNWNPTNPEPSASNAATPLTQTTYSPPTSAIEPVQVESAPVLPNHETMTSNTPLDVPVMDASSVAEDINHDTVPMFEIAETNTGDDALIVKVVEDVPTLDASTAVVSGDSSQIQPSITGTDPSTGITTTPDLAQVSLTPPTQFYKVVCPKCGADVPKPAKVWELKGGKSKKNVLIGLFQCQDCRVKFREALTREII